MMCVDEAYYNKMMEGDMGGELGDKRGARMDIECMRRCLLDGDDYFGDDVNDEGSMDYRRRLQEDEDDMMFGGRGGKGGKGGMFGEGGMGGMGGKMGGKMSGVMQCMYQECGMKAPKDTTNETLQCVVDTCGGIRKNGGEMDEDMRRRL